MDTCFTFSVSRFLVCMGLLCLSAPVLAYEGEFLLFPTLTGIHRNSPMMDHPQNEIKPSLDMFYTASHERFRFLAEFMASPGDSMMERMQIGWLPTSSSTIWLGRFHNPLGYWNTEFHHGNYLTTSISRPSIISFEEHGGGVLPMHISGLLLEKSTDSPVSYSLGLGAGPMLGMKGLMPVEILHPTRQQGKLSASARLVYKPKTDSMDEFGIFTAYTRIPTDNISMPMGSMSMGATLTGITQTLAGAELNQEFDRLRLIGELYIVHNRLDTSAATESHTFTSGYLQAEYAIPSKWTLFSRIEDTADANGDPYLDLHPDFIKSRVLAGARYALGHHHSLKLELSHNEYQDKTISRQLALEWSAVLP
jgi:hypothetical protein